MYNVLDEYIGKSLQHYGEYSQGEADLFEQVVKPGDTVVEAGANIGSHTVHLAQLVGDTGEVWAFEPQRLVFQLLAGNMALNSLTNVHCEQKCLSDTPGTVQVPVWNATQVHNWGGMSLIDTTAGEPVPAIALDSLPLKRLDFLKIDVEGMELNVLKGAQRLIAKFHPVIYTEADRKDKNPTLFAWLRNHGYRLYWHTPPLYNPQNYFGNPVCVFGTLDRPVVSLNVLCIHRETTADIQGFPEVEPDASWVKGVAG